MLGVENAIRTFSEESLVTGGLFTFQDAVKTATADATTRYSNTLANLGISAVRPAVAAVSPSAVPQGTTLDVELTGSNTDFRPGSTVAVAGSGVSIASTQMLSPTRHGREADGDAGRRDGLPRRDRQHRPRRRLDRDRDGHWRRAGDRRAGRTDDPVGRAVHGSERRDRGRHDLRRADPLRGRAAPPASAPA